MLSEDEEAAFAAIVNPMRGDFTSPQRRGRIRLAVSAGVGVAGLAALVAGVATGIALIGVVGFVTMLAGVCLAVTAPAVRAPSRPQPSRPAASATKWAERRWEKRRKP